MPTGTKLAFVTFDGAEAQAFLYERAARRLSPLPGFPMSGPKKPQFDGPAPRTFQSVGAARSAIDPKTDREHALEGEFVAGVAESLEALRTKNVFNTLIVAAPPRPLGLWRERAADALRAVVRTEVAKNYAGRDASTLVAVVEDALLG